MLLLSLASSTIADKITAPGFVCTQQRECIERGAYDTATKSYGKVSRTKEPCSPPNITELFDKCMVDKEVSICVGREWYDGRVEEVDPRTRNSYADAARLGPRLADKINYKVVFADRMPPSGRVLYMSHDEVCVAHEHSFAIRHAKARWRHNASRNARTQAERSDAVDTDVHVGDKVFKELNRANITSERWWTEVAPRYGGEHLHAHYFGFKRQSGMRTFFTETFPTFAASTETGPDGLTQYELFACALIKMRYVPRRLNG